MTDTQPPWAPAPVKPAILKKILDLIDIRVGTVVRVEDGANPTGSWS